MPGARGIKKIEIRSGEAVKGGHEALDAKTAPFIRPVIVESGVGRAAPSGQAEGLKDFLAIGERSPAKSLEHYSEVLRRSPNDGSVRRELENDRATVLAELPLSGWKNFYRYLEKALTFLLGGLGAGMGGPMMIFGSFIFLDKNSKPSNAEEYTTALKKYNDALRDYDAAAVVQQAKQALSVEQKQLLANAELQSLQRERAQFVKEYEHLRPEESIIVDIDLDPPAAKPARSKSGPLKIGEVIDGRYRVDRWIGEGGMGVVYLCTHEITDKVVAVKVMREEKLSNEEARERFLVEAKAVTKIDHPHIIDVKDVGRLPNGSIYLVMENLEGPSLTKLTEGETPVPQDRLLGIALQISKGLAAAHEKGIVHRDLKPENIHLISRGEEKDFVKILDFGIAKIMNTGGKRITQAGMTFGTPEYMPPERALGHEADHRGDIYSFGIILYEMATGKLPFVSEDIRTLLLMHIQKAPNPIRDESALVHNISPELEAIILKAIAKRPEDRYQSMDEMISDLERVKNNPGTAIQIYQAPPQVLVPKKLPVPEAPNLTEIIQIPKRRWPLFGGLFAAASLTALVTAFLATRESKQPSREKPVPTDAPEADAAPRITVTPILPDAMVAPVKKMIEIRVEPRDAHVFVGGKDLGSNRVMVEVEVGTALEVEVRRKGFKTKKIPIDEAQGKQSVRLEPEKITRPRPQPKQPDPKDPNPKDPGLGYPYKNKDKK